MSIVHNPIQLKLLPEPGKEFLVSIAVKNLRELNPDIRAYIVADGTMIQLAPVRSYPGEDKDSVAEFRFFSPLAELSYQFVARASNGMIASSKRFLVRRPCVPRLKIDRDYPKQGVNPDLTLAQKAEELEKLISAYEQAGKILDELKTVIPPRAEELQTEPTSLDGGKGQ